MFCVKMGFQFLKFVSFACIIYFLPNSFCKPTFPICAAVVVGQISDDKLRGPNLNPHPEVD